MSDLIPRKSWTLAFEQVEGVVFHLKEVTDSEFLEASEISEPIFDREASPSQRDRAKIALVDFFLLKTEGLPEGETPDFRIKLNIALVLTDYLNPDKYEVKKQ